MLNHQSFPQFPMNYPQNIISGQILQANGRDSVKAIRMSPNASALVCDSTLPIIYKCVSDSLGNVTISEFDVSPRKTEEEKKAESMENRLNEMEKHLLEIEKILKPSDGFVSA